MRLKTFILQESRSKEITEKESIDLIKKNCKQSLKGTPIYRGIKRSTEFYLSIDPKRTAEPRVSANTMNYYTLINDNSPYWNKYPKRSQSIICSTNEDKILGYGFPFRVFPYDGAKIGICPTNDYWLSFKKSIHATLNDFNYQLFDMIKYRMSIHDFSDESYNNIVKSFKIFDKKWKEIKDDPQKMDVFKKNYNFITGYDPDKTTFLEYVQMLLSPKPNGFKLSKSGDKLPESREVWTDSKSILVATNVLEDVLKELS
jgi:hypothetical protein